MATTKKAETATKDEAVKADEKTTLQTAEQRDGTSLDGVDPFEANGAPDEGLHGNADY